MHINFTFRHLDSTEAIKQHAEEKIHKLDKYYQNAPDSIHVIFTVDHGAHETEITLNVDGHRIVGHASSSDMYASIDQTVHKLETTLRRLKEKRTHHKGHTPASGHVSS